MKDLKSDHKKLSKWKFFIDTIQTLTAISAVIGIFFSLQQFRLQSETLEDTRKVESAHFAIDMSRYLDDSYYYDINNAIQGSEKPNASTSPILEKYSDKGTFKDEDVDEYIGNFEDVGILWNEGIMNTQIAYDEFSYIMEKAWCNQDIHNYILEERERSGDVTSSNMYYANFQKLTEEFLKMDRYQCKDLDNQ